MAETNEPPTDSPESDDDAMSLVEEAEAEAAEAEALAAAARARARAARLRRKALAKAVHTEEGADEGDGPDGAQTEIDEATDDEDDIEADEDIEEQPEPARASWLGRLGGRLPKLSTVAKAAAIILILGFVVVSVYIVWQHDETTQRQQRAASILAGAKQGVINMTSLDFNKARDDVQRVID